MIIKATIRIATLLLAISARGLAAQEPDESGFTLKVKARAVITDVVVSDKHGSPVAGLPASAFRLTDDGQLQRIASFEEHTEDVGTGTAVPVADPGTYTSDTSHFPSVLNVVVIDTISLSFVDQMFLSYQLERLIAALPANSPLTIYLRAGAHSVQLQGVTSDHTLLLNAVHHALPHLPRFTVDRDQEVETLHQIASDLGRVPGRKNVLWFTGSIAPPFTLSSLESGRLESGLRIAYDELQTARIAVYPIDARGLTVGNPSDGAYSRDLMDGVAKATGGTALYNSNGLAKQAGTVISQSTKYYTLSYTPESSSFDGKWHSVRVEVDGKYHVTYRHGYYADDTQKILPKEGVRTRLGLLGNTYQENQADRVRPLVFTATVKAAALVPGQKLPAQGQTRYAIDLAVSADGFKRRLEQGKSAIKVRVAVLAMDRYGMLLTSRASEFDYNVDEDRLREHPEARIPATESIDLNPGDTYLYLVVWDPMNDRAGTLTVPLLVPKAG